MEGSPRVSLFPGFKSTLISTPVGPNPKFQDSSFYTAMQGTQFQFGIDFLSFSVILITKFKHRIESF